MDIKMSNVAEDTMMRRNAFLETDNEKLIARVKELEFDCAELQKHNESLSERVKKLATGKPRPPFGKRNNKGFRNNYKKVN